MNLYLDIETVPALDPVVIEALRADLREELDDALAAVKAPGNYKDEAKIAAFVDDAKAKLLAEHEAAVQAAYLKTGLDGGAGQICVIGWACDDEEAHSLDIDALSEGSVLAAFFDELGDLYRPTNRMRFIGHNHVGFDLPFIWKRARILGIKPPGCLPRNPKPWDDSVFDTMTEWAGVRERISMDKLCRALGIPGKGDISGKDVWPMVQAGRIAEVAEYCRGDVERTRAIYKRMTFQS
jgi:predicted PolB exonuclease-like 3'-5' exonuclease